MRSRTCSLERRRPAIALAKLAEIVLLTICAACASIPKERYAVDSLTFQGVEEIDEYALRACLATYERPETSIDIGRTSEPLCGTPPFDSNRLRIPLWTWPWTDWPLFDRAVFERDVDRIARWYRARGYYDAEVTSVAVDPPAALQSDRIPSQDPPCERDADDEGCRVSIDISLREGEPVLVDEVHIAGLEALPRDLRAGIREAFLLQPGERFDEVWYDRSKEAIQLALAEASYARAQVTGRVEIDAAAKRADIHVTIVPGVACVYGDIRVTGNGELPAGPIEAATLLRRGDAYRQSEIEEAQRAVYALGAFSSVEIEPVIPEQGNVIDVVVRVVPGRLTRFGLGFGVQSGQLELLGDAQSIPQWDVHLLGIYENRNLFGGLRRLRIEERPRLIFQNNFPAVSPHRPDLQSPALGNLLTLEFRQPTFIEPRTRLVVGARWELGPDPFNGFFRHDVDARIGPERSFFDQRLYAFVGLHGNLILKTQPADEIQLEGPIPSDYFVLFLEQQIRLDLRDDPRKPSRGAYFGIGVHEAGFFLPSSWDYIRLTPEARGYVPLPLGITVAGRFAVGALLISDADPALDPISAELGPLLYRLRGGGATSVRGFLPGDLGALGNLGGIRRWEASLELRVPLTADFGVVMFGDVGDVNDEESFRFDYLHTSVGGGLRYQTIVGPLRFDVGWRVPNMQVLGRPDAAVTQRSMVNFFLFQFPGAIHLTIGESF